MKLLTEKEIEEMAIATSKHMYQEMPCSRLSDNEKSYQFKDGFHIGARNGYIEGAQETQKLLLESASEGFEEWWRDQNLLYPNLYSDAWQACSLSHAKKMQEKDDRIEHLDKFCREFVYGEENPEYYKTMDEKLAEKDAEIERLKIKLNTCSNDYWFMINLIEKYGSDKEQTLKDCLERMKFRKPMFNLSESPNSSKEGV